MPKPITLSAEISVDVKQGTSCDYHRMILPYSRIFAETRVPIIVFNRLHSRGVGFLQRVKAEGGKIIADLDDLPELDPTHYLFDRYAANGTSQKIIDSVLLADTVTVTTTHLAEEVKKYGVDKRRIAIVPNALPFDTDQFVRNTRFDEGLIYAAGASHYRDARLLPTGLPQLTFAGYEEGHPEWVKIRALHPHAAYKVHMPLDSYMSVYEGHKIALAPLRESRFNACKSNLKMLEAGARGLAFVASPEPPYNDFRDMGYVLHAPSRGAWGALTTRLLQDPNMLDDWAQTLAQHVREQYQLDRANKIRRHIIESLQ